MMAGVMLSLLTSGCVEPQSGITVSHWCKPSGSGSLVIDDMEDGDAVTCDKKGRWSVMGEGMLRPAAGPLALAADLEGDDLTARAPSVRAVHLSGTLAAGESASLFLALSRQNLTGYDEIQFWARSDGGTLELRVNVLIPATTDPAQGGSCDSGGGACGNHYGEPQFEVTERWGSSGLPNSIALLVGGIEQPDPAHTVPRDFGETLGVEFRVSAPVDAAQGFGLWIDDIQLKGTAP
jgi:hypothetical protein